jgi:predicted enzyme related to lactoylglutathione lyase
MSERDGYEPGVPCWVDTLQPDPEAAASFYADVLGWEVEETRPPGSADPYYLCRLRGRDVAGIGTQPGNAAPQWTTYVWVENADELAAKATGAGGSLVMQPFDALDGGRIAVVSDPAGAALAVWKPGAHKGAGLVNEPGGWAMSQLTTSDPDGAKAFYGAVFGWETETFDLAGAQMTMWKVPGYVGGEPQQPVARDVVATMAVADGAAADVPPHWGVDFWIQNLDEAVSTATRLGAELIGGPHDIPEVGMRNAALADPRGATFSLTQPPGVG